MTVPAELSPGDAMLYTGRVRHGGGANTTRDRVRSRASQPVRCLGSLSRRRCCCWLVLLLLLLVLVLLLLLPAIRAMFNVQ